MLHADEISFYASCATRIQTGPCSHISLAGWAWAWHVDHGRCGGEDASSWRPCLRGNRETRDAPLLVRLSSSYFLVRRLKSVGVVRLQFFYETILDIVSFGEIHVVVFSFSPQSTWRRGHFTFALQSGTVVMTILLLSLDRTATLIPN